MTLLRPFLIKLRDALIQYLPPDGVLLQVQELPEAVKPISPDWVRKDESVDIKALSPQMSGSLWLLAQARRQALLDCLDLPMTITSGAEGQPGDGVHMSTSAHYTGNAVDLSVMDFARLFAQHAKAKAGKDFDVIAEKVSHVHVEYDPKVR